MKFWTAHSDDLVVEMSQCHSCDKWIPAGNMELHLLYHQQHDSKNSDGQDDQTLPAFVMETIPCEDCRVLVPKDNWELHRAHVCRARQEQQQSPPLENEPPTLIDNTAPDNMQVIECEACGTLVPTHNLELHETRACQVLHPATIQDDLPKEEEPAHARAEGWSDEGNFVEEWECPRCTFNNEEAKRSNADWKCTMCGYSLVEALEEQENNTRTNAQLEKKSSDFWTNLVDQWVPQEYHQLLPESMIPPKKQKSKKRTKKNRKAKPNRRTKPGQTPPSWEVRQRRNPHLSLLEREQQQYLQLLQTTRQEASRLLHQEGELIDNNESNGSSEHRGAAEAESTDDDNKPTVAGPAQPQHEHLPPPQPQQPSQLELLQATEQLCLYHLENLRRTRVAQQVTLDIELLGLPRWRHHLHHLLDLYQSASEVYVGNIIWELRMHFFQYATLEMMALLELKIWKEQIVAATDGISAPTTPEARRACRNDQDISIICQSVLPFLGRPQTPALRAL